MKPDYALLAAEAEGRAKHYEVIAEHCDADAREYRMRARQQHLLAKQMREQAATETA